MARFRTAAELADLDMDALRAFWSKIFRCEPPPQAKREFLLRLLAYGLQEQTQGARSRTTKKALEAVVRVRPSLKVEATARSETTSSSLRLGTRLVRSWNGATHEVTVLDRGFAYRGRQYRSLSEIAEVITGAHWSGPRFFGLNRSRAKPADRASA